MFLPERFWITQAPDGFKELSRIYQLINLNFRTFFFPITFRMFFFLGGVSGSESHTAADAVSNCMHWLSFIDFDFEKL